MSIGVAANELMRSEIEIPSDETVLPGILFVPTGARDLVLFAHGSGSSRLSPRNRYVADGLNESGIATLLFDLLTPREEIDRANVFDIELLAGRLAIATAWASAAQPGLALHYFGASTGAAAALWAAAGNDEIASVVSRGGRPDLAAPKLGDVTAPTLLIVGAKDRVVLDLNRQARTFLRCECSIEVVAGATHLFEEPGALERVAELATGWFASHGAS